MMSPRALTGLTLTLRRDYAGDAAGSAYESSVDWIRGDPVTDRKSALHHPRDPYNLPAQLTPSLLAHDNDRQVCGALHDLACVVWCVRARVWCVSASG